MDYLVYVLIGLILLGGVNTPIAGTASILERLLFVVGRTRGNNRTFSINENANRDSARSGQRDIAMVP